MRPDVDERRPSCGGGTASRSSGGDIPSLPTTACDLWRRDAWTWLQLLAETEQPFTIADVRGLDPNVEPLVPQAWGSLVATGHRAGLIEAAGATVTGDGRAVRVWRGRR